MNTIFIADDNNTDRLILESALKKLGFEVVSFSTGTAIYEAIRNAGRPVVALLDWLMPDREGVDICNELSTNPPIDLVYTIIVTSRTNKSDIAYALDNGADDFVAKPFDITELRARINVGIRLLTFRQQLLESNGRLLEHTKHVEVLAADRATQLVHADRLSTIGILSAGIAHEINNPTSFVAINIQTLEDNCHVLTDATNDCATDEQKQKARFFISTIPDILKEMKNGVARITNIVTGLKTYTHAAPGNSQYFTIDICIESALQLCSNKLKYHMKIIKKINPTPQVFGDQYQIEQVLVNLITNASDAIEETGNDGVLTISTEYKNNTVITYVRDSGPGIPINSQEKIFTPFFTTKPIGKGTGLGLSISRNIIKDHKGDLLVTNHPDGGAQFTIVLPSKQKANL